MNIFLAEDNESDVYLIKEALSQTGMIYTLLHLADGEAAIQALQTLSDQGAELTVALLDLNLPKRSGHQIIAQLRASVRFQSVPIVVLTSSDSPKDRQAVTQQGVEHYFRKPIDPHEFFRLGEIVKSLVLGRSAGVQEAGEI